MAGLVTKKDIFFVVKNFGLKIALKMLFCRDASFLDFLVRIGKI